MKSPHCAGNQAGGYEDDKNACPLKEAPQIDARAADINDETDPERATHSQCGTDQNRPALTLPDDRGKEEDRFKALPPDGKESQQGKCEAAAILSSERSVDGGPQIGCD